jgi:hypothetical protein
MKARFSLLSRLGLSIAFVIVVMSAGAAVAQSSDDGVAATAFSGVEDYLALSTSGTSIPRALARAI